VLKELWELWGTADKLLSDSTKISAQQLPDTCFDKDREVESHSHPISAFQGRGKTAEMLSASVAWTPWKIAVVIRIKVNRDLSKIKRVSFVSGSNVRLGSLSIQEKEKETTKQFEVLAPVWLFDSELMCGWMKK